MKFEKDDILEVAVGIRSHVTKPYYVLVEWGGGGEFGFRTSIPGAMKRDWVGKGGNAYDYHKNRCKKVGTLKTHGHLLYNQELKLDGKIYYSADNPSAIGRTPTTDTIEGVGATGDKSV